MTFPGTVASLRQMWGRAGRRNPGLAMYVAGEDALDQFFCRHPTEFLERPVEQAILDHESEQIHEAHLAAAAYELPLTPEDGEMFGPRWEEHARRLVQQGALRERGGRYLPRGPGYPAARIALRSASPDSVSIVEAERGEVIGNVETARAHSAVHPGAVYLHMGAAFEVEELDLEQRRALVRPFNGDWYTQPKKESETWIEQVRDQRQSCGVALSFGIVSVTEQVVAYQKKQRDGPLRARPAGGRHARAGLRDAGALVRAAGLAGARGVPARGAPGLAARGRARPDRGAAADRDVRPLGHRRPLDRLPPPDRPADDLHLRRPPRRRRASRAPGFERFEALVGDALRLISECRCESGCPSCVQSPKCGNLNEPLNKRGAIELLSRMAAA